LTEEAVADATVTLDPSVVDGEITTDAEGNYSVDLPVGSYTVTVAKTNFTSAETTLSIVAATTTTNDVALVPVAPVVVTVNVDGDAAPANTLTASVTVTPLDGSEVQGVEWSQTIGAAVEIDSPDQTTTSVQLPDMTAFKEELIKAMTEREAGMLDRFVVQGLNSLALEEAAAVDLEVTVTTTGGAGAAESATYTQDAAIHVTLPWQTGPGVQDVPIGVPVLLQGKDLGEGAVYDWSLTAPGSSATTLMDAESRNPYFTPDVVGNYEVSVTDTTMDPAETVTLAITASTWVGVITGQDANGRPLAANCTICHNGTIAPDKFTEWAQTGHAEIFTDNFNTSTHYSTSCLGCHTVGYLPGVDNGGFDDAAGYQQFLDQFTTNGDGVHFHANPDNWDNMLMDFPDVAKLANIQCENCHGPNPPGHGSASPGRISLSSDVCGTCHGEPARHGRFQQWQESPHANYELAIEEATVQNRGGTAAHCGRCHSAQGFLAWLDQGDLTKWIQGASGNASVAELTALGLTVDTVHPQTCTACHDPHAEGKTSGDPNTATVRVQGSTPLLPAGFAATGVGRGAVCITCHNTRNGAHNDSVGNPTSYSAPHVAAQADVLMGQNAYFVTIGQRSPHSFITDTCANCHMALTPPPADLSYQLSGTNHTFRASLTICSDCHGVFDGGTLQESTEAALEDLGGAMGANLLSKISAAGTVGISDYTPHEFDGKSYDVKSAEVQVDAGNIIDAIPTEVHGQQAFTVKFSTPVEFTYTPDGESPHTLSLSEANVQLGDFTTDEGATDLVATSDVLVRAGWNYDLVHGDASGGIHNPSFVLEVIEATKSALEAD